MRRLFRAIKSVRRSPLRARRSARRQPLPARRSARRQPLPARRSARRRPLPARRSARKSVSIKAPAAVAHRPVPRWLIHRRRRHRGPRHRRAPPRRRRPREPPHIRHPRRAPPRRRRGRQHRPPSPSASRVNTAEFCRAGSPLRRERAASGVERLRFLCAGKLNPR